MSLSKKLWFFAMALLYLSPIFAYDQLQDGSGAPSLYRGSKKDDKQHVDKTLAQIFNLLDLKTGGIERVYQAGLLLGELLEIHEKQALGSDEKYDRLQEIAERAEDQIARFGAKKKDKLRKNLFVLKGQLQNLNLDARVHRFLFEYLILNIRRVERVQANISASIIIGPSGGVGFGVMTSLSGKRSVVFCPSIGTAAGLGGDVSLEYSKSINIGGVKHTNRAHFTSADCPLTVVESSRWQPKSLAPFVDKDDVVGMGVGIAIMSVVSANADMPFFRLRKKYGFARQQLGIKY